MSPLERMEIELQMAKSNTAKLELMYKIGKAEENIVNMKDHVSKQEDLIKKLATKLKGE